MAADVTGRGRKIVHVINRLGRGGAEKQLLQLVDRSRLDHEIVELAGRTGLAAVGRVQAELRRADPEVVVAWLDRSQIATAAAPRQGRCLIASVRGLPGRGDFRSRWLLRAALARYDEVVTNSDATVAALEAFISPLRLPPTSVIPNGVENVAFQTPVLADPLRLGFIGRANMDKGVDVFLAALSRGNLKDLKVTLVGAGIPEFMDGFKADRIDLEAISEHRDPWSVIGPLDVLVVPSRSEGMPNVVLEAMARGTAVVATDVGGTSQLLGAERGLLIPPEKPEAIAEAIAAIRKYPESTRERARRAREFVLEAHDWAAVVNEWDDLLLRCLGYQLGDRAAGVRSVIEM